MLSTPPVNTLGLYIYVNNDRNITYLYTKRDSTKSRKNKQIKFNRMLLSQTVEGFFTIKQFKISGYQQNVNTVKTYLILLMCLMAYVSHTSNNTFFYSNEDNL